MMHLIWLEMKKYRVHRYVKGCAIANLCLFGFLLLMTSDKESPLTYNDFQNISDIFIRAVFLIYSSCLMGTILIAEYRDQMIYQTFSYPISRKKIISAKLLIVCGFVLINVVISQIFIYGIFYLINQFDLRVIGGADIHKVLSYVPMMGFRLFGTLFLSLIPFTFGMRKHSIQVTIGTAIVVVALSSSYNTNMSNVEVLIKEAVSCLLGVLCTIYTLTTKVNRLEESDI